MTIQSNKRDKRRKDKVHGRDGDSIDPEDDAVTLYKNNRSQRCHVYMHINTVTALGER